jgi:hypothetical protein
VSILSISRALPLRASSVLLALLLKRTANALCAKTTFPFGFRVRYTFPRIRFTGGPDAESASAGESAHFRRAEAPIVSAVTAFHLSAPYFESAPMSRPFLWPFCGRRFLTTHAKGRLRALRAAIHDRLLAALRPTQRGPARRVPFLRGPQHTVTPAIQRGKRRGEAKIGRNSTFIGA